MKIALALKRLAAIVFFAAILFNFYGYRLVISYMQVHSDASLEKQVDQNKYDNQQLISIKTKLDLPYYSSSPQYERVYGTTTVNGISYQYVKRRVYKDTMELLCLPNDAKTKMQSVSNELTKELADGQATTPKKNSTIKISLPDFFQAFKTFSASSFTAPKQKFSPFVISSLSAPVLKHKKPPKPSMLLTCDFC